MPARFISFCFFLVVVQWGVIPLFPQTSFASEPSSLISLVQDYFQERSIESSQVLLQAILQQKDASLQTVEAAIRQVPEYSNMSRTQGSPTLQFRVHRKTLRHWLASVCLCRAGNNAFCKTHLSNAKRMQTTAEASQRFPRMQMSERLSTNRQASKDRHKT